MMNFELNVVLVEPEIPQNTGSIGRLCVGTKSTLHLIEPLGFEISSTRLKRAGLDYWEHLKLIQHKNIDEFIKSIPKNSQKIFFSKKILKPNSLYELLKKMPLNLRYPPRNLRSLACLPRACLKPLNQIVRRH